MMVGVASHSSPPLLSPFPQRTLSPFRSPTNLPFSNRKFQIHHNRKSRGIRNTRTTIPQAKLSGLGDEVEDQLEEAFFGYDEDIEEDDVEDDEETESSLDLLFRFMQSLFKKVSKKTKKATRSILPPIIAPQLISFAVDGVLLLTSLSIVKAFLEVVCTLGGTVFVAILLLRLTWATISHFQSSGNRFNQGGNSYGSTQPVT